MTRTCFIYEPTSEGHRLHYAEIVMQALADFADLCFCSRKATYKTPEYRETLGKVNFGFRTSSLDGGRLLGHREVARAIRRHVRQNKPNAVYIPTADGIIQTMGIQRGLTKPWARRQPLADHCEMLVMRGHDYLQRGTGMRNLLKRSLSLFGIRNSGCHILHVLDSLLFERLSQFNLGTVQLELMPESPTIAPIDRLQARRILGIRETDKVIGYFGRRCRRKGCDLVLNAFGHVSDDVKLLIMGKTDAATDQQFAALMRDSSFSDRIFSYEGFQTNEMLTAGISAVDATCLAYPSHLGSSGFLVDAVSAGTFVVAADQGWIGRTVQEYDLGSTCNVHDERGFAAAINHAFKDTSNVASDGRKQFLAWNNSQTVCEKWSAGIRSFSNASEVEQR